MSDPPIQGIVLSVDQYNLATCYSVQLESLISVKVPNNLRLLRGQNFIFSEFDCQKDVFIPNPNARTTRVQDNQQVVRRGSSFFVKTIAACSNNPSHQTYRKKLAYAGQFGLVELAETVLPRKGITYSVLLALSDLNAAKNGRGSVFKLFSAENEVSIVDSIEFMKTVVDFEKSTPPERWAKWAKCDPRVKDDEDEDIPRALDSNNVEVEPPRHRQQNIPHENENVASRSTSRRSSSRPPSQSSQFSQPINEMVSTGMVTSQQNGVYIVYLTGPREGATLRIDDVPGPMVRIGTVFECNYVSRKSEGTFYDVVRVIRIIETKNIVRVVDNECYSLLKVDLFGQDEDYITNWVQFGGCPIVNSEIGPITVADRIADPTGQIYRNHDLLARYHGRETAKQMLAWCRFVLYRVPRMAIEMEYAGTETVYKYGWRLIEVTASADQFKWSERLSLEDNLGNRFRDLEIEDDVARQKRLNKQSAEYNSRPSSGNGQESPTDRPPTTSSSSSYHTTRDDFYWRQGLGDRHREATSSTGGTCRNRFDFDPHQHQRGGYSPVYTRDPNERDLRSYNEEMVIELQTSLKNTIDCLERTIDVATLSCREMRIAGSGNPQELSQQLENCAQLVNRFHARKHRLMKK